MIADTLKNLSMEKLLKMDIAVFVFSPLVGRRRQEVNFLSKPNHF
ncbi:hypothetical protein THOG05_430009 [Vibrio rotiferianus]|nr:hypothetical protein THOG05_430009 [Vibrio rotiferianus]CAH1583019.1 hypothetical protein THOG10_330010 [Vibrio rotiferianus]CAH1585134.1 hypothetical protein THOB06_330010 [Vibrio rotiferianus]CAH1588048.1 hypothetical protein THOE12_90062 [Vibrio rotiferianus]